MFAAAIPFDSPEYHQRNLDENHRTIQAWFEAQGIFYSSQLYYTELLAFTYFNCYNDSMDDEKGRVIAAFLRYFNDDPERAVAAIRQYTARNAAAQTKTTVPLGSEIISVKDVVKTYKVGRQKMRCYVVSA